MTTPILNLSELHSNQAGSDVYAIFNEVVRNLEAIGVGAIISRSLTSPPSNPVEGRMYIPASPATDAWQGLENKVVQRRNGVWESFTPFFGMKFFSLVDLADIYWDETSWQVISVGGTIDDGDKGDIAVSNDGTIWELNDNSVGTTEIADGAITLGKIQGLANAGNNKYLGTDLTGSAGIYSLPLTSLPLANEIQGVPAYSIIGNTTSLTKSAETIDVPSGTLFGHPTVGNISPIYPGNNIEMIDDVLNVHIDQSSGLEDGIVTYNKIQETSTGLCFLGNPALSGGIIEEIPMGAGFVTDGSTVSILNVATLSDGVKGDLIVSDYGAVWTIDPSKLDLGDLDGILPLEKGGTGKDNRGESLNALLPDQTANAGKVLTTNGTNPSWSTLSKTFESERLDLSSDLILTNDGSPYLYLDAGTSTYNVILPDPPNIHTFKSIVNRTGTGTINIKEALAGLVVATLSGNTRVAQCHYDGVEWEIIIMGNS